MKPESILYFEKVRALTEARTPFVSVTLVASRGHVPQELGAKILVTENGLEVGTVGGGRVEAKAIEKAKEQLAGDSLRAHELVTWNLQRDVGMTCGGEVTFFFEAFFCRPWDVVVFGAGHVAQSLVRILLGLDCSLTCIDPREEWLAQLPDGPNLTKVCTDDMPSKVTQLKSDAFVMLMTQGHKFDVPILEACLRRKAFPYLGVIGSQVKGITVRKELIEKGLPPDLVNSIRCPMGLPLGDNSPNEIAISMVAELLQTRDLLRKREPS